MTQTKITENHMRTSQHTDVISDIFTIAGYLSTLQKLLPPGWLSKTTGLACRRIVRCFRSLIKPMGSQSSRCCSQDLANATWLYEKKQCVVGSEKTHIRKCFIRIYGIDGIAFFHVYVYDLLLERGANWTNKAPMNPSSIGFSCFAVKNWELWGMLNQFWCVNHYCAFDISITTYCIRLYTFPVFFVWYHAHGNCIVLQKRYWKALTTCYMKISAWNSNNFVFLVHI